MNSSRSFEGTLRSLLLRFIIKTALMFTAIKQIDPERPAYLESVAESVSFLFIFRDTPSVTGRALHDLKSLITRVRSVLLFRLKRTSLYFYSIRNVKALKDLATMRLSLFLLNEGLGRGHECSSNLRLTRPSLPSTFLQHPFKHPIFDTNINIKNSPTSQHASRLIQRSRERRRLHFPRPQFGVARYGVLARARRYSKPISTHGSISHDASPSGTCQHVVRVAPNALQPLYFQRRPIFGHATRTAITAISTSRMTSSTANIEQAVEMWIRGVKCWGGDALNLQMRVSFFSKSGRVLGGGGM